jgi:lipid-A-disaccharide synthase
MRSILYPLGFIANLLFGARFFLQWIHSEKQKTSIVTKSFWQISLAANLMMFFHGFLQIQYPVCLIQSLNAVIAWRNLNLMGEKKCRLVHVICLMSAISILMTGFFFLQEGSMWMRTPMLPWDGSRASDIGFLWHLAGFLGMLLFASRYWFQWWLAEKNKKSFLEKTFWQISCLGALFSLAYAIKLKDPVNIIGFSVGFIPYLRNLMLLKKRTSSMLQNQKSLFLLAGEQSGDLLGKNLIISLKESFPTLKLCGVGGAYMKKAGMEVIQPMESLQVMGFYDVIRSFPRLYASFKKIKNEILRLRPSAIVLIDYPDFNIRLAKALRKSGYDGKIIHYVCPSIWAWRKKRIFPLAKNLNHLLTILPFEKQLFTNTQLPVTYVGHPLVSTIDNHLYDSQCHFPKPLIAIFPGSRKREIALNLPLQLAAAEKLGSTYTIAISVARPELRDVIQKYTGTKHLFVPAEKRYELMQSATAALATSGTIILELGLHAVPTVTTYALSTLDYLLGRYIFRIHLPFYTLVNIICDQAVYPELIHRKISVEEVYRSLEKIVENQKFVRDKCSRLKDLLKEQNASQMAAKIIFEEIHEMPMP